MLTWNIHHWHDFYLLQANYETYFKTDFEFEKKKMMHKYRSIF